MENDELKPLPSEEEEEDEDSLLLLSATGGSSREEGGDIKTAFPRDIVDLEARKPGCVKLRLSFIIRQQHAVPRNTP